MATKKKDNHKPNNMISVIFVLQIDATYAEMKNALHANLSIWIINNKVKLFVFIYRNVRRYSMLSVAIDFFTPRIEIETTISNIKFDVVVFNRN